MKPRLPEFNREKCAQRRKVAALRDGVEAASFRFLKGDVGFKSAEKSGAPAKTVGSLPADDKAAMKLINAAAKEPIERDQVYIHYLEAASDNFIDDRYMFMGPQTLRNIALQAARGTAFMNSHATGGLSGPPAELPFGHTFCGQYSETANPDGSISRRTVVGIYMLKGVHPNGTNGPSTDTLHRGIQGAVIRDVSVGLYGGDVICDVCAANWSDPGEDDEDCYHYPGSTLDMDEDQIEAQKARGVTKGRASYTLEDANFSEVSAVYDGAVPGAGFRRNFSRLKTELSPEVRAELRATLQELLANDNEGDAMPKAKMKRQLAVEAAPEEENTAPAETTETEDEDEEETAPGEDPIPVVPSEDDEDENEDEEEEASAAEETEVQKLQRENAELKAQLAKGEEKDLFTTYADRFGRAGLEEGKEFFKSLAPAQRPKFEKFVAALPIAGGTREKTKKAPADSAAFTGEGASRDLLHKAILENLAARDIAPGSKTWGKEYAKELAKLTTPAK